MSAYPPDGIANTKSALWREEFPLVIVAPDLTIQSFTTKASSLFGLNSSHAGQHLTILDRQIESGSFQTWVTAALAGDRIEENEIRDRKGYWYSVK